MKHPSHSKTKVPKKHDRDIERELISNWKQKQKGSFDKLYRHFKRMAMNAALKILGNTSDAEDVIQDVFMRIHLHEDKFEEGTNFKAWLYRITINMALNLTRRKYVKAKRDEYDETLHRQDDLREDVYSIDTNPQTALENKECREQIETELEKLQPERRKLIILCELEGYSYEEAAKKTQTKIGTIMSRLFRARRELRALLTKKLDEYPGYTD